jgi:hypothetical protein
MTFAHGSNWYLFCGKIVQIQLLAFVLIHTPVKVYITLLGQKSQILHYIFIINNGQKSLAFKGTVRSDWISLRVVSLDRS